MISLSGTDASSAGENTIRLILKVVQPKEHELPFKAGLKASDRLI